MAGGILDDMQRIFDIISAVVKHAAAYPLLLLLLLLLLLTPNILKKTENRILLSVSELGRSTNGKDPKKEHMGYLKTQ